MPLILMYPLLVVPGHRPSELALALIEALYG